MAARRSTAPSDRIAQAELQNLSLSELSLAALGTSMTMGELCDLIGLDQIALPARGGAPMSSGDVGDCTAPAVLWIGSIGYEQFRDSRDFARRLLAAGVERLIDVRELPISRRRGYAKTALRETMEQADIEYVHMRALGNPKPYRDLYKSGRHQQGREKYRRHLLENQRGALVELVELMQGKRSALMCVEHDPAVCHRTVIVEALRSELGLELDVEHVAATR
jgi:hypothetical protein